MDLQDRDRSDREPRLTTPEDKSTQHAVLAIVAVSVLISVMISGSVRRFLASPGS